MLVYLDNSLPGCIVVVAVLSRIVVEAAGENRSCGVDSKALSCGCSS